MTEKYRESHIRSWWQDLKRERAWPRIIGPSCPVSFQPPVYTRGKVYSFVSVQSLYVLIEIIQTYIGLTTNCAISNCAHAK